MGKNDPLFISKSNQRALVVFLVVALLVVFIPRLFLYFEGSADYRISSETISELNETRTKFEKSRNLRFKKKRRTFMKPKTKFDPNNYLRSDWEKLGLTPRQAEVVVKFCSRGIYSNEQLKRIFVIPTELYELIKDSTIYPERKATKTEFSQTRLDNIQLPKLIEINTANLEDLDQLPGIGSFYARNILNYRDKLGGYVNKEQLLEVWKMDPLKYNDFERFIITDETKAIKININSVSLDQLKSHPYIRFKVANSLIKMRQQRSGFKNLEEIKDSELVDEELFEKIKPYLTL